MRYQEYKPSKSVESYVQCFYTLGYDNNSFVEDKAFATGCVEVMFTLHGNPWETKSHNAFVKTSPVELWGQILQPLTFRTSGHGEVFGIRFYPATASLFIREDVSRFNDGVFDVTAVTGNSIGELHARLQEARSIGQRIELAETFLRRQFESRSKSIDKVELVRKVMNELTRKDFFDNIDNVAARYGITSRYLQKVFVQHTGLTPKLYSKINRFQNSLVLMSKGNRSLTSIAYDCGYFDQSHFIREFKSFAGFTPSDFDHKNSTAILASPNK